MAYDRDDIEKVRQSTNIVELVEGVTTVKRQGRSFKAICPFHQEKSPSLSLDPVQGFYHCFGCNAGGDVFRFVQETQGLDFGEAVELLASRAGITLRRDPQAAKRRSERDRLVKAIDVAVDLYHARLRTADDGGPARAYLRGRGYDSEVVEKFRLGYSPEQPGWDTLVRHLREGGVSEKTMVDAGLAVRGRGGRLRDWFHGRVMFPIFDLRGDPVGFGARLLEGDGPKYLNSPETRLYQKAKLLYGLNWAKADITRAGFSLVVEGYTDVIALHLAGMPQAVATCGTALGEDHFDLLRRFADRVVLAFDADQAGAGAALRGDELQTPIELALDLRVAVMAEGSDPADLVQEGRVDVLREAVAASEPLLQFRITKELDRHALDEPEERARAVRSVAPLIARQDDGLARDEYARLVSRRVGIEMERISAEVEAQRRTGGGSGSATARGEPRLTGRQKAERELLRVMMVAEGPLGETSEEWFRDERHRAAYRLLTRRSADRPGGPPPDLAGAVSAADPDVAELLRALAVEPRPLSDGRELTARLERWHLEDQISGLRRRVEMLDPDRDGEPYSRALRELIALERRKRELGSE